MVADVEQQHLRFAGADRVDQRLAAGNAALLRSRVAGGQFIVAPPIHA